MVKWRYLHPRGAKTDRRIRHLWPNVDRTIIYQHLLDYGVNAQEIPVIMTSQYELDSVMGMSIDQDTGELQLLVATDIINSAYPDDESKYIGLVHELAHFRQALIGGLSPRPLEKEWHESQDEQEAVRWSARQARLMGWSEKKLTGLLKRRYRGHTQAWVERVTREGQVGFRIRPEQETLGPLFRRPVRVRQYRRRR